MSSIDICLNCTAKKCAGTCQPIKQAEHEERRNFKLTVDGETHTLAEWAKITGLDYSLIMNRIYKGKKGREIIKPKRRANNGKLQTNS